jgi:HD-GYP domain-containing protein (c-di-GMP phosphodiesterase class II)
MPKVLVDNCSQGFFKLMRINLRNYFNVEIEMTENLLDQLSDLESDCLAVVSVDNEYSENCEIINKHIEEKNLNICFAVIGKVKKYQKCTFEVESEKSWPMLIRGLGQYITENNIDIELPDEDYFAIEPDILKSISRCSNDIYIKIERKGFSPRYMKRIHAGEIFEAEDVDRYVEKGVESFYIERNGQKDVVKALTVNLMAKLDKSDMAQEERLSVNAEAYSNTKVLVQKFGLTPETINCSNATIQSMEKVVEDEPDLFDLYSSLTSEESNELIYNKSQLTVNMATQIVNALDLDGKDSAVSKLTYAAFFNDIYLNDWDKAKIRSQIELKESDFGEEDVELITTHAAKALQLLEKYPQLPIGVGEIIKEHHGTKIGKGFSDTLPQDLNQLSVVFLIAEEIATHFMTEDLSTGSGTDYEDILDRVYTRYNQSFARKCVNALREVIVDKNE